MIPGLFDKKLDPVLKPCRAEILVWHQGLSRFHLTFGRGFFFLTVLDFHVAANG